jgi:hypothetical protein
MLRSAHIVFFTVSGVLLLMKRSSRWFSGSVLATALCLAGAAGSANAASVPTAASHDSRGGGIPALRAGVAPALGASPAVAHLYAYFNGGTCVHGQGGKPYECLGVGAVLHGSVYLPLVEESSGGRWTKTSKVGEPSAPHDVTVGEEVSCAVVRHKLPDCMMVGVHYNYGKTTVQLAEWGGPAGFRVVAAANPRGTSWSSMQAVSCPTAKFCVIGGQAGKGSASGHATAYTWNGSALRAMSVPAPPRSHLSQVAAISCVSTKLRVAVGDYDNAADRTEPYTVIWRDGKWKLQSAQVVAGATGTVVEDVSCPTSTFCMAAGYSDLGTSQQQFTQSWNGRAWRLVSMPAEADSGLNGVSCLKATACMVGGVTRNDGLIERWSSATGWSVMKPVQTGKPNADVFTHLSWLSPTSAVAFGLRFNPSPRYEGNDRTLAERWNGKAWTVQSTENS